jgi:hypothetical protein
MWSPRALIAWHLTTAQPSKLSSNHPHEGKPSHPTQKGPDGCHRFVVAIAADGVTSPLMCTTSPFFQICAAS